MGKLLVIGQAPGPARGSMEDGIAGAHARRMPSLFGVSPEEYLAGTERRNLLREFPGKAGKGDAFPLPEARLAAEALLREAPRGVALFLGKRVARAFGVRADYFCWSEAGEGLRVGVVPHPSGINRWWNDLGNLASASGFAREAWRLAKEAE